MENKEKRVIKTFNGGSWIYNSKQVKTLEEADVVILPGGGDWNPALYGHKPVGTRYFSETTDKSQMDLIDKAIAAGKLVFGICRGLNVAHVKQGELLEN